MKQSRKRSSPLSRGKPSRNPDRQPAPDESKGEDREETYGGPRPNDADEARGEAGKVRRKQDLGTYDLEAPDQER
jgi:hypothetical protein